MGSDLERPLVGPGDRVGLRIPLGPRLGVAPPPPEALRALPAAVALEITMTVAGYRTPNYRLGRWLARHRRHMETMRGKATA